MRAGGGGPERGAAPRASGAFAGALLASLALAGLVGALAWSHARRAAPEPAAPETALWVDPAAARLAVAPIWADPRWIERVQTVLTRAQPFPIGATERLALLERDLAALSFVERVELCRASEDGGLELELTLREPVACIPTGAEYALVDEDGVVLEGRWPEPPRLGRVPLPVLGPVDDPLFRRARDGDWLVEPEHLDALDVALSLAEHLDEARRAALGPLVIDARTARRASVDDPGVRIALAGERQALFGRAPAAGEPGELAPEAKWDALARALELYQGDPDNSDWDLVDLRWDRPDLALRAPTAVAALAETTASERSSARGRPDPDPTRPRVR